MPGNSKRCLTPLKYVEFSEICAPLMSLVWMRTSVGGGGGGGSGAGGGVFGAALVGAGAFFTGGFFGTVVCADPDEASDSASTEQTSLASMGVLLDRDAPSGRRRGHRTIAVTPTAMRMTPNPPPDSNAFM